ncbi:MAG TPA: hypothetical protein VFU47_05160, partial [Armatimonadota bacterium]|nr:hypothetical protein [Armatimonadota bacterium]
IISERLGHSSVRITLDLYGHILGPMERSGAEAADQAMRPLLPRPAAPNADLNADALREIPGNNM